MRQVQVVSPEGKVIRRYRGGNLTTSNVASPARRWTSSTSPAATPGALFRLDLGVKGLTILPPKAK